MSYSSSNPTLQLADEGKFEELEELLTKGKRERFLVEGVYEDRWTPFPSEQREGICSMLLLYGMQKEKEDLVSFARKHGAKVDNAILCTTASMQDKKLFREVFSQMGEEKIDWRKIMSNILCAEGSLRFFQHLVDDYLGDEWEKFLPDQEDISDDADTYITLLKRFNEAIRDKVPKP